MRVGTELIVHGETTEIVAHREKLLRSCFVMRMEIENLGDASLVLKQPEIAASVPFPVSRWYLEGGDGEPWDGSLGAGERRAVRVIGYTAEPVKPGAAIEADITFASLAIAATTQARKRWDQTD